MRVDWDAVWKTIVLAAGASAAVVLVAWLVKTTIAAWVARNTETFKAQLKANADIEEEKLRSSLQIIATEYQVKFSKLHEARAQMIAEVHKKLTKLQEAAEVFVVASENDPCSEHKEENARLWDEIMECFSFIQENRIYLPTAVCELLDKHLREIRKALHIAGAYRGREYLNDRLGQRSSEAFTKAYDAFNEDIPEIQNLLEAEFRKLLGVQ